jgi:hypothetical protein
VARRHANNLKPANHLLARFQPYISERWLCCTSTMDAMDTPSQLQPNQADVGVLALRRNPPYAPTYTTHGPAPHGAAYSTPNAPPSGVPRNSGTSASSEPGASPSAAPVVGVLYSRVYPPFSAGREEPGIGAYLHIPCVKKLYEAYWGMSATVTRLYNENRELREYLERVERDMDRRPWMPEEPMD